MRSKSYHTRGDDGVTLGIETVHHVLHQRQLALNGMTQEIGIDQHIVWRDERSVVLEVHVAGHLGRFADEFAIHSLLISVRFGVELGLELVGFQSGIALTENSLNLLSC